MAAHRHQPLGNRQIAVAQGSFDHGILRQRRTQLAPEGDALEERAGPVHAGQTQRQGGVHMEMRIDEGRAQKVAARIDDPTRLGLQTGGDLDDAARADADALIRAAIGQGRIHDKQIEHGRIPPGGARGGPTRLIRRHPIAGPPKRKIPSPHRARRPPPRPACIQGACR